MNTLYRNATTGGVFPIDVIEHADGWSFSLRDNERFTTADAAADAALPYYEQVMDLQRANDMTDARYRTMCAELGETPHERWTYSDEFFQYSVYEHGRTAVAYKLHQVRCWQVKREREAVIDSAVIEAQAVRSLRRHVRAMQEEEALDNGY